MPHYAIPRIRRYAREQRILHWVLAILILGLIAVGWWMEGLDRETAPYKFTVYGWHKSLGMIVLLLVLWRISARHRHGAPELPHTIPYLQRMLANMVQGLMYLSMLAVPISGYIMSEAAGYGVSVFGWKLPQLMEKNTEIAGWAHDIHGIAPYVFLGLIALHIAGALKHRFFDRPEHNVLRRML